MKYTISTIRTLIAEENTRRGFTNPTYKTIGAIRLYQAYGMYAVDEIDTNGGGVRRLMGLGTKNEIGDFLADLNK